MHPVILTPGDRYNMLRVIEPADEALKNKSRGYRFQCDCGRICVLSAYRVRKGTTKSCGCLRGKFRSPNKIPSKHSSAHWQWKGCGNISGAYWFKLKSAAKRRGLEFAITIEYAWDMFQKQQGRCNISGVPIELVPQQKLQVKGHQTASLDRIDSAHGYTEGNIQWVHKEVNWMKMDQPNEDFIEWCRIIAKHNPDGGQDDGNGKQHREIPLGVSSTRAKLRQARRAIRQIYTEGSQEPSDSALL